MIAERELEGHILLEHISWETYETLLEEVGERPVIVRGGRLKRVELVLVPPGVVTEMGPVAAQAGTVACRWESLTTL